MYTWGDLAWQYFERQKDGRSEIIWAGNKNQTYEVDYPYAQGRIRDCFYRNGGWSAVGGAATITRWWTDVIYPVWNDVVVQQFRGGSLGHPVIIDNGDGTPACLLRGAIWDTYVAMGGPISVLRRPRSDELIATPSRRGTTGRLNRFEGGSIYYSSSWGTHAVWGRISSVYEAAGGTGGVYGFPITEVFYWGDFAWQWFEGDGSGSKVIYGGNRNQP